MQAIDTHEHHSIVDKKIEERLMLKSSSKSMSYYVALAQELDKGIHEVLCETESCMTYNELAEIFAECFNLKTAKIIAGDIEFTNRHEIRTTFATYIWHYASLKVVDRGGDRPIFIVSRDLFQSHIKNDETGDGITTQSSRDWFLQKVISPAVKMGATDIHIVPIEQMGIYRVYFRVLGEIRDITTFPKKQGMSMVSMLLYWAKEFTPSLRFDETRKPQDARIEFTKEQTNTPIDCRLSFIPKSNMKDIDVVARLLYKIELKNESIQALGFNSRQADMLNNAVKRNKGIVLVTGATGTGKSRTVNTLLSAIEGGRNVLTVEDPIEYMLPNARQFQVIEWENSENRINKVDFMNFARAFKRHDPDVIFIGELRDRETVDSAFHLSKTGHLVFATLHTSRATMVPEVLVNDYGVNIDVVADNLIMAVNQVLVKKICNGCSGKQRLLELPDWVKLLHYRKKDEIVNRLLGKELSVAGEKNDCSCVIRYADAVISKGYSGRTVYAECIEFEPAMFHDNEISVTSMDEKAARFGSMLDDAVDKIIKGITDVDSLKRLL